MSKVLSDCEKIKCTPLPLSYSRHSSRFFTLFSLTLPFSLVKDTTPLLIGPIVVGIAWILFATDEIGRVIEEPFGSGLAQEDVSVVCVCACVLCVCVCVCARARVRACVRVWFVFVFVLVLWATGWLGLAKWLVASCRYVM